MFKAISEWLDLYYRNCSKGWYRGFRISGNLDSMTVSMGAIDALLLADVCSGRVSS